MEEKKSYKWFNYIFLLSVILAMSLIAILNYVFDPLMIFHKPWFDPLYFKNERYRIPGFARSLDYDTAIIGASSAAALLPQDIRAILDVDPVLQSIGGATIREESLAVDFTARQGKLKKVIWLLDPATFNYADWRPDVQMPLYLYQDDFMAFVRYLLSGSTLLMSISVVRYQVDGGQPGDFFLVLDSPYQNELPLPPAYSCEAVNKAFHSEAATVELQRRERGMYVPYDEAKIARSFFDNVTDVIQKYPNITFDMVLSPSTTAFYQFLNKKFPARYSQQMFVRKLAYQYIPNLPNARLFDMQIEQDMAENYENFSDMLHYSPTVGRRILEALRDGRSVSPESESWARDVLMRSIVRLPLPDVTCARTDALGHLSNPSGS